MSRYRTVWIGFCLAMIGATSACSQDEVTPKGVSAPVPAELQAGEAKFAANCAGCHGPAGIGTSQGPPLVHKIYEPNHHSDAAFQRAAASGVQAHHWGFGNMPKIETVTPEDVDQIIKYVRWLQKQAGIF
jgi:mono/diheme cytochrome c family protein